jgi:hypothetical protein
MTQKEIEAELEIEKLTRQLNIALAVLNKLGIAQSGAMDYTTDFYELCKTEIRGALDAINGTKPPRFPY